MRRLLVLIGALACLWAQPAVAAVAHDGEAAVTGANGGATTTITLSAKTTAGSDRLGVLRCTFQVPGNLVGNAATWNGVTMGAPRVTVDNADGRGVRIWAIVNPPTTASDVVVDANSGGGTGYICTATSYNGVDQTTPVSATNTASGTATTATVDCTAGSSDTMIVDSLYYTGSGTSPSVGANQTQEANTDQGSWFSAFSRQDGADGDTMSWTVAPTPVWSIGCATLAPVSGGAAVTPRGTLLGVLP
jgi:hypothetical protein